MCIRDSFNMKQGFFVDEIWSYGLSNSYYHAHIWEDNGLDNVKIDPEMFRSYLTAVSYTHLKDLN